MKKNIIKQTEIAKFLILLFMFITICNLFLKIKADLSKEQFDSFNLTKQTNNKSVLKLKTCSDLGWFNLKDSSPNYEKGLDIVFICFQYMIVPTILEKNGYNKKIICYYTSPEQLADFCQKKKKYRLIEKDIFEYFALLERKD